MHSIEHELGSDMLVSIVFTFALNVIALPSTPPTERTYMPPTIT